MDRYTAPYSPSSNQFHSDFGNSHQHFNATTSLQHHHDQQLFLRNHQQPPKYLYASNFHYQQTTRQTTNHTHFYGYAMLIATFVLCVLFLYALLFPNNSHHHVSSHSLLLPGISSDRYFSMLAILALPVTIVGIYLNWLGMKFFRHN
eukprot:GEZU01032508.1.p1 GENE.GEZU01032508.1~~GEZU01032508.1.p1  ORF type:complete len:147 (-),score=9.53 GEZU01032508.1:98-538(-)